MANRFVAIIGARQRGKTTGIGYAASMLAQGVDWTATDGRRIHIPSDDVQIGSKTLKHAKDFIKRSARVLQTFDAGITDAGHGVFDSKLGSTERIALANGREIRAHAGDPDTIAGFSGHVVFDEVAANNHDPEDIFQQSIAVASGAPWRKAVFIGNSSYKGDWWHNLWNGSGPIDGAHGQTWEQRREQFHMVKLDIWSEFPDRILPPDLREIQDIMGPSAWSRWYECEFADALERAISEALIIQTGIGAARTPTDAPIVLSIDPGLNRNPSGIVVARVGNWAIDVLEAHYWFGPTENDPTTAGNWIGAQLGQIDQLVERYTPSHIVVDYSNLAAGLGDALEERYGSVVDKQATTRDRIQKRWGPLLSMLTDGRVLIPSTCEDLRADLARLEVDQSYHGDRRILEAGILRLPETVAPNGKHVLHCDIGAALLQVVDYVYQSVE